MYGRSNTHSENDERQPFSFSWGNHTMNVKLISLKSRRLLVNDLYRLACLLEIVLHVDLKGPTESDAQHGFHIKSYVG